MPSCPNCGNENVPQNKYCGQCGATLAENLPLDEQVRTDLRDIKQRLFQQPKSDDELQILRIEEPARQLLVKWLKLSFIPLVIIVTFFSAYFAFIGFSKITDFIGAIDNAKGQITSAINDINQQLNTSTKDMNEHMKEYGHKLDDANISVVTFQHFMLENMATERERSLLNFHTDRFKRTILKVTREPNAQQEIASFKVLLSGDPNIPPLRQGELLTEASRPIDNGVAIASQKIGTPNAVLFDAAQSLLAFLGKVNQLEQPGGVPGTAPNPIDQRNSNLVQALACYLVEIYIETPADIRPCNAPSEIAVPAGTSPEFQQFQEIDRATAKMLGRFRKIATFSGMGNRATVSLLMSAWLGAAGSSSEDRTYKFFLGLEAKAKTIGDRQNLLEGSVGPEKLAELIHSISPLSEPR